jgi:hypothetical protein
LGGVPIHARLSNHTPWPSRGNKLTSLLDLVASNGPSIRSPAPAAAPAPTSTKLTPTPAHCGAPHLRATSNFCPPASDNGFMTKPHDQYARLLLDQMLSGYGSVLEEFPLSPSPPRAVDLVFVPNPTAAADAIPLGALAPLSTGACLVEVYSRAPGRIQYDTALGKLLDIHRPGPTTERLADAAPPARRDAVDALRGPPPDAALAH